jgi:hypothetical protein
MHSLSRVLLALALCSFASVGCAENVDAPDEQDDSEGVASDESALGAGCKAPPLCTGSWEANKSAAFSSRGLDKSKLVSCKQVGVKVDPAPEGERFLTDETTYTVEFSYKSNFGLRPKTFRATFFNGNNTKKTCR